MRMSEGVEWCIHCTMTLAMLPSGQSLPGAQLAELHGVPAPYLAKHLQLMSRAGLITSQPGPRGGYRLARPANEITVLDVVEAVEGPEPAFRCTEIRRQGAVPSAGPGCLKACCVAATMDRADSAWRTALRSTTIEDLVICERLQARPGAMTELSTWFDKVARKRR
ncbi:MAG TPA: Rrf2 family transcriptional regulator [Acidimicrobiales bacterium]|jgi:Rrf2 family protein